MISLYQDIMISLEVWRVPKKVNIPQERDKQVQVRLPAEIHKGLKLKLIEYDSSLANFFNEAAEAYLANPEKYMKAIKSINGGKK